MASYTWIIFILTDLLTVEPHTPTSEPVKCDNNNKKDGQWYTHNGVDVKDTLQRKGEKLIFVSLQGSNLTFYKHSPLVFFFLRCISYILDVIEIEQKRENCVILVLKQSVSHNNKGWVLIHSMQSTQNPLLIHDCLQYLLFDWNWIYQ